MVCWSFKKPNNRIERVQANLETRLRKILGVSWRVYARASLSTFVSPFRLFKGGICLSFKRCGAMTSGYMKERSFRLQIQCPMSNTRLFHKRTLHLLFAPLPSPQGAEASGSCNPSFPDHMG
ncbi:hypothetical protein TNCV_2294171 [Trichonephila clavipes]|nr:hypothetical protein TNCV_2294171 [Trichonephila clavipes]